MIRATKLGQIYQAFRTEPLAQVDLKNFYRDTYPARGKKTRDRIARLLRSNFDTDEQIILVGYRGCGKSTELNLLAQELENEFLVMNISILRELDPVNLQYIEIFIATMEQLFEKAKAHKLRISKEMLDQIQAWVKTREIEEIREKYNIGAEVETGGGYDVNFFAQFFAKFRLTAKSSRQLKETLKENVEPKITDLIAYCNDLINEIRLRLKDIDKKDILLILEDLDKIPVDRAENLFYNYANQLTQVHTNVIFTFPVTLYYNTRFNTIKAYFSQREELEMIKVREKDGSPSSAGLKVMRSIVDARMASAQLFASPELLDTMILYSGGVLRDLFLLITEAASNAIDHDRASINDEDWQSAYHELKKEYSNNIADYRQGSTLHSAKDYFLELQALAQSKTKLVVNSEKVLHLRQNLCILGYNGTNWCDVHPIVKDILKDQGYLS